MRRRISSLHTFATKFLLPVITPIVFVVIQVLEISSIGFRRGTLLFYVFFVAGFILYVYFWGIPLKYVEMDDNNLYVSNYRREIVVPISQIERVTEWIFSEPRRVTVHLKNSTEFGQEIVFLATYRAFAFFDPHPITEELERRALSIFLNE